MKTKMLKILLLVLVCLVAFCFISVITGIYTPGDLQINYVGTLLGTVIAAVVTALLLSGQSSAEEVKERNVKVFEKKADIFQKYIDLVWDIWDDHIVTSDEYDKLTSSYYKELMLYLNKDSLNIIGDCLEEIGDVARQDTQEEEKLKDNICKIINTLSDELSLGGNIDPVRFKRLDEKREAARKKRPRLSFKVLGIPVDASIEFVYKDKKAQSTVSGENKVLYGDEEYSLTRLTKKLMEIESDIQPSPYWYYNGKSLKDLYEQKYAKQK
jgi:gas vesicle protein